MQLTLQTAEEVDKLRYPEKRHSGNNWNEMFTQDSVKAQTEDICRSNLND